MSRASWSTALSLEEAMQYHHTGRLVEAEALFRKIISLQPNNAVALHSLGILLADKGDIKAARQMLEEAIVLQPKNFLFYRTFGTVLVQEKAYQKAKEAFQTALYLNSLDVESVKGIAKCAEAQGDMFTTIRYYKTAIEITPNDGQVHFLLGKALGEAGFVEESLQHLEKSYILLPFELEVLYYFGFSLLQQGRLQECEKILQQGLRYYPQSVYLQHLCGIFYFRLDMFDEALSWYERALPFAKDNRQLLVDYAVCLRTVGDDRSAEQVLTLVKQ